MNKRIIISLGVIAILLTYLIIVNYKDSGDVIELEQWKGEVDEIVIRDQDNIIKLFSKEGKWVINDEAFPADSSKVSTLERKMKELKVIDMITRKEHYDRYELTLEKAIRVTLVKDDNVLRDVLIGKESSNFRNTYIKFYKEPEIYLASSGPGSRSLHDEYDTTLEELRDKEIYNISKDVVKSVELKYKGRKLSFIKVEEEEEKKESKLKEKLKKIDKRDKSKKKEKWICNEYKNVKLDTSKINSFVSDARSIRAISFPDIDKKSLKRPVCTITFDAYDKNINLKIHSKDKSDRYLCTSSETPYVFTLAEWKAKKYFKKLSDFIEEKKEK